MRKFIVIMVVLGLLEISLALYLTHWREVFWNYVQAKDLHGFIVYLCIFTIVALALCVISASSGYAQTLAAIKWREKLNVKAMTVRNSRIENTNQRIQQDCSDYPCFMLSMGFGVVKAFVYLAVFSVALVLQYKAMYLVYITLYAAVATIIAKKVANPLVALNYKSQQMEATYRNNLSEINFSNCITVMLGLAKKTKHLQYFQTLYGQVGIIIPLVIIAPAYFLGAVSFGGLMQGNSIMSTIVDNLSYGVNNFDVVNRLLSCRKRLKEIGVI